MNSVTSFVLPQDMLYFNGNSLGPLPCGVEPRLHQLLQQWGEQLVEGWNDAGWLGLPQQLGDRIGRLLGAAPGQTLVCDSTSINIFKLLHAALARHPQRKVVLIEDDGFPTDAYIAQGIAKAITRDAGPGRPGIELVRVRAEDMAANFDASVAAALINHVNYRSGARVDMAACQKAARRFDIPVVWDLAHSAGAVPLELDRWGIELAVGCSYKFLNGGPGAPAFLYARESALPTLPVALAGWFGHARPFAFESDYAPAAGIERFQVGTPGILGMAALSASLDVFDGCCMDDLWQHSQTLFQRFADALEAHACLADFQLLTPRDANRRGSQISLSHPEAYPICQALAEQRVIADYREPGVLRFGLTPLYLSIEDVDALIDRLLPIMRDRLWQHPRHYQRKTVT